MASNNRYYVPTKHKKTQREILREKQINVRFMVFNALLFVAFIMLVFAVVGFLKQNLVHTAAEFSYEEVANKAVSVETHSVDFNVVQSYGTNSTSWIYIPDTKIDYPLVQGNDNDFYIDNDAYGNPSRAGAIFINFANSSDMSDVKTVIFGHNMATGAMFTDLHKYASADWGQTRQNMYIYMDSGEIKHYRLLYYIYTEPLDPDVYVVSKQDVLSEEIEKLRNDAKIVYNEASGNGNLICLSTCSMHVYRTVIVFEYVDNNGPILGSSAEET